MTWQIGTAANGVIALAYFLIALAIVVPLARSNQLRTNPLGAATAAIFLTCAVHHGSHRHLTRSQLHHDEHANGQARRKSVLRGFPHSLVKEVRREPTPHRTVFQFPRMFKKADGLEDSLAEVALREFDHVWVK